MEDNPRVIGATGVISPEGVQKAVQWVHINKAPLLDVWSQECCHDDCHFVKV